MTFSDKYGRLQKNDIDTTSNYPKAFGVTLTPAVSGVILSLLGLTGAAYIMGSVVAPLEDTRQQLTTTKEEKQAQIRQLERGETDRVAERLQAKLRQEQALKPQVLALFSDERTLDTLLLDLNRFVSLRNAQLTSFQLQDKEPSVINDGSLGRLVDGKLKRQTINVEIQGTYNQTLEILRDIERLQSLLVIKDLRTEVNIKPELLDRNGQIVSQSPTTLKTNFKAEVLMPLNQDELKSLNQQAEKDKNEQKAN